MTEFDREHVHVLRSRDDAERRAWFRQALKGLLKVKTKEVIAIKPNLGSPLPASTGATTDLWMIEETVRWVQKRRARPLILEGPSHVHPWEQVLELTGAGALFDRLGVEVVDARTDSIALRPLKDDDASGPVYRVHPAALSADGIVCLPKLKTHNRTGITVGMKGLMGLLSWPERHRFHRRGVTTDVVELYRRLRHRIRATFVDGVIAMEGHGPTNGRPVNMDVLVAGTDTVSVDAVCGTIMGFPPDEVDHLCLAHDQGLGDRKRAFAVHPQGLPLPVRIFERPRYDSGLRTKVITFPPVSKLLRAGRIGVRGRTKPVRRAGWNGQGGEAAAEVCPTGAIDARLEIDYPRCVGCALCLEACPQGLEPEGRLHKLRRVGAELLP